MVTVAQHQVQLFGRELRIDNGERTAMEGQIPACKPWIFHLSGMEMMSPLDMCDHWPLRMATGPIHLPVCGVLVDPFIDVVKV
jgi:hypothetical protein